MLGLRKSTEADLEKAHALMLACEVVDQSGTAPTLEDLRHRIATPGLDVQRHVFVLPDDNGELIALCGGVPLPAADGYDVQSILHVRPDHRSAELEDDLLAHIERETERFRAEAGGPATLRVLLPGHQQYAIDLYTRNGYVPARCFVELERDLTQPIEQAPIPEGFTIRTMGAPGDLERYHITVNESFQDHWNPQDISLEYAEHLVNAPEFQPRLTLLASDPEGNSAGFCANNTRDEFNARHNKSEGLVSLLGVRRPYRRNGLARALLTRSLQLLRDEGMLFAIFRADQENPNKVIPFYGTLGCKERARSVVYEKPVGLAKHA
jgi:mycothiol synthase